MGIEIFSKNDCKYCEYAEDICKKMNLDYTKTVVDKNPITRKMWSQCFGIPTNSSQRQNTSVITSHSRNISTRQNPCFSPIMSRFTVFPIEHENLWALYKKAQMSNWTAEEIDVTSDMEDLGEN